jgi:hypothetical protein
MWMRTIRCSTCANDAGRAEAIAESATYLLLKACHARRAGAGDPARLRDHDGFH